MAPLPVRSEWWYRSSPLPICTRAFAFACFLRAPFVLAVRVLTRVRHQPLVSRSVRSFFRNRFLLYCRFALLYVLACLTFVRVLLRSFVFLVFRSFVQFFSPGDPSPPPVHRLFCSRRRLFRSRTRSAGSLTTTESLSSCLNPTRQQCWFVLRILIRNLFLSRFHLISYAPLVCFVSAGALIHFFQLFPQASRCRWARKFLSLSCVLGFPLFSYTALSEHRPVVKRNSVFKFRRLPVTFSGWVIFSLRKFQFVLGRCRIFNAHGSSVSKQADFDVTLYPSLCFEKGFSVKTPRTMFASWQWCASNGDVFNLALGAKRKVPRTFSTLF